MKRRNVKASQSDILVTSHHVTAVAPSLSYLNKAFTLKCAPDLIATGYYPNAKEWTEAVGMWEACASELDTHGWPFNHRETLCVVVGDGSTPRLGAMMAFRSAWTVLSVDPALAKLAGKHNPVNIKRLEIIPEKIQDLRGFVDADIMSSMGCIEQPWRRWKDAKLVVLACHSHADMCESVHACLELFADNPTPPCAVVACQCCRELALARRPDVFYEDWAVHSKKRAIKIWKSV